MKSSDSNFDFEGGESKKKKKISVFDRMQAKKDLKKFKKKLGSLGLVVREVGGDGNCLFRAVADQMDGDQTQQRTYREGAVCYIEKNGEEFEPFIRGDPKYEKDEDPVGSYCKHMSKNTTWGGQLELNAMAKQFQFNVFLHQVDKPSMIHCFHEPMGSVPTIHLSYHLGRHYNSVRRSDDPAKPKQAPVDYFPIGHDPKNLGSPIQKLTPEEMQNIEKRAKQVYTDTLYDEISTNVSKYLGWLFPNAQLNKLTIQECHQNLMQIDNTQNSLQKALGLVDSDSDSDDNVGRDHIDEAKLKKTLRELRDNDNLIVDIPKHCELHNLAHKKRPSAGAKCPCADNSEGLKYSECCQAIDRSQTAQIIGEVMIYFEEKDKDIHLVVYV